MNLKSFISKAFGKATAKSPTFADLSENPDPSLLPLLDRPNVETSELTDAHKEWRKRGVVILPQFMPENIMDEYIKVREQLGLPGGWGTPSPYIDIPEMRSLALYPPLMEQMKALIGEDLLLHLALTGWVSTERNWHQDDYLNPSHVNCYYTAVWIALDDIHPDAGPFEYIPGSHKWPLLRGEKVRAHMSQRDLKNFNDWPWISESFVVPAIEEEIERRDLPTEKFIAKRGDVLIWHSRLMHRGTLANQPGMMRKSLICHYSGVEHRDDMPNRVVDENGQNYAIF